MEESDIVVVPYFVWNGSQDVCLDGKAPLDMIRRLESGDHLFNVFPELEREKLTLSFFRSGVFENRREAYCGDETFTSNYSPEH